MSIPGVGPLAQIKALANVGQHGGSEACGCYPPGACVAVTSGEDRTCAVNSAMPFQDLIMEELRTAAPDE